MSLNASALAASEASSRASAGSSRFVVSSSAARWTAEGKTSFDDWPMFTWSFACASSPASVAMTSLAFMFVEVPEPVWKTSIGNWASWSPATISSAAAAIRAATASSSRPSSPLTRAAAPLIRPSCRTTATGTRSPETGKFATALVVSPPHSWSVVSCTLMALPPVSVRRTTLAPGERREVHWLGRHVVRVELLAAVRADHHRVGDVTAGVAQGDRGLVVAAGARRPSA